MFQGVYLKCVRTTQFTTCSYFKANPSYCYFMGQIPIYMKQFTVLGLNGSAQQNNLCTMGKDNILLENPKRWFYRKRRNHKTTRTIISSISARWPTVRQHTSLLFNIRRASRWSCNECCHEDCVLFLLLYTGLLTIYRSCYIKYQSALTTKACGNAWKNRRQFDNTITVHKLPVDSVKHTFLQRYTV